MNYSECLAQFEHAKNDEVVNDHPAALSRIQYSNLGNVSIRVGGYEAPITEEAFGQFLEFAGGPGARATFKYGLGFPAVQRDGVMAQLIDVIHKKISRERKMMRLHILDETIHGVTSDKYVKVYDADLLTMMEHEMGEENFKYGYRGDNVSVMRFRTNEFEAPDSLKFITNVQMENNQYGRHSLSINPTIERQICTNGATVKIAGSWYSIRHVGDVSSAMIQKNMTSATHNLREFEDMVRTSYQSPLEIEKALRTVQDRFRLGKKDIERVRVLLGKEQRPDTYYGVANAISALANEKEGEQMLDLQVVAGKVYMRRL